MLGSGGSENPNNPLPSCALVTRGRAGPSNNTPCTCPSVAGGAPLQVTTGRAGVHPSLAWRTGMPNGANDGWCGVRARASSSGCVPAPTVWVCKAGCAAGAADVWKWVCVGVGVLGVSRVRGEAGERALRAGMEEVRRARAWRALCIVARAGVGR